eukprot:scaffold8080_cov20-Prasinocladus_malaysianus.AAC.1
MSNVDSYSSLLHQHPLGMFIAPCKLARGTPSEASAHWGCCMNLIAEAFMIRPLQVNTHYTARGSTQKLFGTPFQFHDNGRVNVI